MVRSRSDFLADESHLSYFSHALLTPIKLLIVNWTQKRGVQKILKKQKSIYAINIFIIIFDRNKL